MKELKYTNLFFFFPMEMPKPLK